MIFGLIEKVRLLKPIYKIQDNWVGSTIAGIFSGFFSYFTGFFQNTGDFIVQAFNTDPFLIFCLGTAMVVDFITGITASKKRKNPIKSLGARQSGIKFLEYTLVLSLAIVVANTYGKYESFIGIAISYTDVVAFGFFTWIEILSIKENLTSKSTKRLKEMIDSLDDQYKDKLNIKDKDETKNGS